MTTPPERWLLDTNIWVFSLRRDEAFPNCAQLLERLGSFDVVIPLQVLKELNLNLTEDEISDFYRLINQQGEWMELSWAPAPAERVKFYEERAAEKEMRLLRLTPNPSEFKLSSAKTGSFCKQSKTSH